MRRSAVAGMAGLALAASTAGAQTNLVTNGSFESGFTGWTIDASDCATHGTVNSGAQTTTWARHDGAVAAYLNPWSCDIILAQPVNVLAGHTYQMSFWWQWRNVPTGPDYHLAFDAGSLTGCDLSGSDPGADGFFGLMLTGCSPAATGTATIHLGGHNSYGALMLDDVRVVDEADTSTPGTTTPEPASLALLGTGLIGLVPMIGRRRR